MLNKFYFGHIDVYFQSFGGSESAKSLSAWSLRSSVLLLLQQKNCYNCGKNTIKSVTSKMLDF